MTDYPIIMNAPMVKALLEGRKTQTRRLPKGFWPKVKTGDRLWVRETWATWMIAPAIRNIGGQLSRDPDDWAYKATDPEWDALLHDRKLMTEHNKRAESGKAGNWVVHPSPRWASRLTLVVTAAKMERFDEISEEDARASAFVEGRLDDGFDDRPLGDSGLTISSPGTLCSAAGMAQIFYHDTYPDPLWDAYSSPECVALTFDVHLKNIDQMEAAA